MEHNKHGIRILAATPGSPRTLKIEQIIVTFTLNNPGGMDAFEKKACIVLGRDASAFESLFQSSVRKGHKIYTMPKSNIGSGENNYADRIINSLEKAAQECGGTFVFENKSYPIARK